MNIIGLDADTNKCGWSFFVNRAYEGSGVFVPEGGDWMERIFQIRNFLSDLLFELTYQYGKLTVGYEVASGVHGNMHTNRVLGAVHWACWDVATVHHAAWIEVNVQSVKASGCHKDAVPYARGLSGKPLDHPNAGDEADAMGVALAVMEKMGWKERGE